MKNDLKVLLNLIAQTIYDKKGINSLALDVRGISTLTDYAMPIASELPHYETDSTVTLTTVNPLGVKGVGEAGTIGSTPAVSNAIIDALGVAHLDMPYTAEKLWKVIHQK